MQGIRWRRFAHGWFAAALTVGALLGAGVVPATAAGGAGAAGTGPGQGATSAGAVSAEGPDGLAVTEARRTGKPVDVGQRRTESSDTVAQPDGRLLTTTYVQPHWVRRGGAWVDIDPTLTERPGGVVVAKAATAEVEFSGGGSGRPLVRMASAGRELRLSWPKPLPKPDLQGSTAEYRSVLPDVDLRLTATRTGFTQVLVVHTPQAAKNPELGRLRLGLQGNGLTVKQAADGSMTAVDKGAGGTVFEASTPVMWDSAPKGAPAGEPKQASRSQERSLAAQAPATPSLAAPGEGAKVARIGVELPQTQDGMVLTPDRSMLDNPGTVYPVMIDPAWNTPHAGDWAGVSQYYPSQSYWHFTYTDKYVGEWGVGYCGDTSRCQPRDVKRAFFQIPTSQFAGKHILSAEFVATESWSFDCSHQTPVELWNTGYINSDLTWDSQNSSGFWNRYLQTAWAAKGWSGDCPAGQLEFGGDSGPVRDLVQDAANWGWSSTAFGLKARDESDLYGWKKFTDDAALRVYYNVPPRQTPMSDLTMSPGMCVATGVKLNKWPQLTANASDPDGEAIGIQFAAAWDDGTGFRRRWWSTGAEGTTPASDTFKASGSAFSITLPALPTPAKGQYGWEVRAWDGADWGPWSSDGDPTDCYFSVDTTAPDGPAISSASYPGSADATAALPWTDGVGRYGSFTVKSKATDVTKYQWAVDSTALANEVAVSGGAAATVNLLPEKPGLHTFTARAVDGSGNASQPETYYFNVLAGQPQRTGWAMDDASGTRLTGTAGRLDATLGSGASPQSPGHLGDALAFDGTANGYASTQGAVLDTARSFTVSAWVKLANADRNRSAVSQSGSYMPGFSLGLRNGSWAFETVSTDDVGYGYQLAGATGPATLNQWTHLTGVYDAAAKTVVLYVNGVPAGAPVAAPASWSARGSLELGRMRYRGGYNDPWSGALDEVKVWDRALSAGEAADVAADRQLTAGLPAKAVWHLDGNARTTPGTSESDDLTVSGGTQLGIPGVADKAIHLDGTSGYARTARPMVDGTKSFSVSSWVRLPKLADGDTAARVVINQIGAHNNEFSLYYSAYSKKWIFGRYKEDSAADTLVRAVQPVCSGPVNGIPCFGPNEGQWTHLLGVSDAASQKLRLYINGTLVAETDYVQTTPWPNPGPVQIGAISREGKNGDFFDGDIDDVRLYDRVVTASEAADMVKQRPQLVGRWRLDTATGSPLVSPDESSAASGAQLGDGAKIDPAGGLLLTPGALQLDGVKGYAQSAATPLHTDQSFTLAAWADTAGVPTRDMTVLSQAGANGNAVTVRWHYLKDDPATGAHLGEWQAEVNTGDGAATGRTVVAHSPATSVLENWTHLAVTYDALVGQLSLYVNGQPENQLCTSGDSCVSRTSWGPARRPFDAGPGLQFGRARAGAGSWGEYFSGELDDVWAYQGILSAAQIAKLADYNADIPTKTGP
ncbi:LamG domain-containing protein [Kitasatospora sp. NPDC058190]|uniref:LamG domain-containing protein n=1 Tax=Kitasatospora sp. NPDC058190 TaxID=3346371 RepID=UPI0036D887FE